MQLASLGIRLYKLFESHKRKFIYIPLASYWLLIFVLTSIPGKSLPKVFLGLTDKAKHFGAYLLLSFLLNLALHFQKKYKFLTKYSAISTLLIVSLYGILDEIHQIFIPGRYFELFDFLADVLGAIFGILISHWIIQQNKKIISYNEEL